MAKITWSKTTPLSPTNLNGMQDDIYQKIEENTSNIEANTIKINDINTNLNGKLLWTNPNPNNAITTLDITINLSDYDFYEIIYRGTNTSTWASNTGKIPKEYGGLMMITDNHYRRFDIISNGIRFNSAVDENRYCIPLKIIGYKIGG